MGFIPFYKVEPESAERETRTITVLKTHEGIPEGTYGLIESYCPDPACDCRRVMLNITYQEQLERGYLATIGYGFDRDEEMAGPFLDPLNPQSEHSEALLELVTTGALSDPRYVERLAEHYHIEGTPGLCALRPAPARISLRCSSWFLSYSNQRETGIPMWGQLRVAPAIDPTSICLRRIQKQATAST